MVPNILTGLFYVLGYYTQLCRLSPLFCHTFCHTTSFTNAPSMKLQISAEMVKFRSKAKFGEAQGRS